MQQMIVRVEHGNWMQQKKLDALLAQGWTIKHSTTISRGYDPSTTCCLGCLFLPLALLGKKKDIVEYVLERSEDGHAHSISEAHATPQKPVHGLTAKEIKQAQEVKAYAAVGIIALILGFSISWFFAIIALAACAGFIYWYFLVEEKNHDKKPLQRSLISAGVLAIGIVGALALMGLGTWWVNHNYNQPEAVAQRAAEALQKAAQAAADQAAAQKQAEDTQKVKDAEKLAIINEAAPAYCKSHTKFRMIKVDNLVQQGYPMFNGTGGFTDAECKTIMEKLYEVSPSKNDLMRVANEKVWVGMDYRLLLYSWGAPNDSNSTTSYFGNHVQFVYGDPLNGAQYVYVDNGVVTSYQN